MNLLTMNNIRIIKNLINNSAKSIASKIHNHGLFIYLFYTQPMKGKRKGMKKKKKNRRKNVDSDLTFWRLVCLCPILMHP